MATKKYKKIDLGKGFITLEGLGKSQFNERWVKTLTFQEFFKQFNGRLRKDYNIEDVFFSLTGKRAGLKNTEAKKKPASKKTK